MKVGFISQWYAPETGSAALPTVIAQGLRDRGHEVKVVTGIPNYPLGKVYPGYKARRYQHERHQGVAVHRAPLYPSHDDSAFGRVLNYTSFALSASVIAARHLRTVDAVWVHGTPATVAAPAQLLRALRGIPFVYHVQDLWPETVLASGMLAARGLQTSALSLIQTYCDSVYRNSAQIAISAPGMRSALLARHVPDEKIVDLPNWCDESIFAPMDPPGDLRRELGPFRPFTVMYAGAMGEVQGLDSVIDAAQLLHNQTDIGFALVGDGVAKSRLVAETRRRRLTNIKFIPSQPLTKMASILALGDVQLVCLRKLPIYGITLPSKVQATLASGRPIICAAAGNAASVVAESGAGITVSPESGTELASAVLQAREAGPQTRAAWGRAGRQYYVRNLSEAHGLETMSRLLEEAAWSQ